MDMRLTLINERPARLQQLHLALAGPGPRRKVIWE